MAAVGRDVQPVDAAPDAEAGVGNCDGRLGIPGDRPIGLGHRPAEGCLAVRAGVRKVPVAEGQRPAAERVHLVEGAAPDHGWGHGPVGFPGARDLGGGPVHGGGDPLLRRVGDAAIILQRPQGAVEGATNEIAHRQRVEHQGIVAALGRAPVEPVMPDEPQRVAQQHAQRARRLGAIGGFTVAEVVLRTIASLLLLLLLALAVPSTASLGSELRVAAWNLEHLNDTDGQGCVPRESADYDAIAQQVVALRADVVAFQEVDNETAARRIFPSGSWHVAMSSRPAMNPGRACWDRPAVRLGHRRPRKRSSIPMTRRVLQSTSWLLLILVPLSRRPGPADSDLASKIGQRSSHKCPCGRLRSQPDHPISRKPRFSSNPGGAITTLSAHTAAWDTGRRPRKRWSRQAGRPAPLRSAGHPAWRRNRQCTGNYACYLTRGREST